MRNSEPRRFHTGIDATMILVIVASVAPLLVLMVVTPSARTPVLPVTAAVVLLLFFYLYRTTYYVLDDTQLCVRCGPIREEVPYEALRTASHSRSMMSGYAMSMQRIRLEYNAYDDMLISPADRDGFFDELQHRAPHVVLHRGDDR